MKTFIQSKQWEKIFYILMIVAVSLQLFLDTLNQVPFPEEIKMKVSASIMLALILLNGIRTYFDPVTENNNLILTLILFVIFVCGYLLDNFTILKPFGWDESIFRTILTLIISISTSFQHAISKFEDDGTF